MEEMIKNIIGLWSAVCETPFGIEEYDMNLSYENDDLCVEIYNEKGKCKFNNFININSHFESKASIDYPLISDLNLLFSIKDNHIIGSIKIDEYVTIPFLGKKKNVSL